MAERGTRPSGGAGRAAVGLLLVFVFAGLAGCSAPGHLQAAATTTTQPDRIAAWRELIQCVRTHGMPNLPDPHVDSNGEPHWPGGEPPEPPQSVQRACRPAFEKLAAATADRQPVGPADVPALLRFARCMREHGMPDWPDPKADGTFPLAGTSLEQEGKSPRFIRASQACDRLNPDPRGRVYGS
jgi:hypothetical protein